MRVLFVSLASVQKENSSGNTFLNVFSGMENIEFASVFLRAGESDTSISQNFCITEKMLIKNLLGKGPAGMRIQAKSDSEKKVIAKEKKLIQFMQGHRWAIFFLAQKLVWKFSRWRSKELNDFVADFQPDVIFTFLSDMSFLNRLILHIRSLTNAKLVVYAWDNNYSLKQLFFSPLRWMNHLLNRRVMKRVAKQADVMYVISDVQKIDYEKAFRRECKILTKSDTFLEQAQIPKEYHTPLKLVFTGNIALNRWKSLAYIANALEKVNQDGLKAQMRIYTGSIITRKMRAALQKGQSSLLMGSVSAEEVAEIQKDADLLIHAEAMDLKNKLRVRQSFSTKLVDYFHQAKCILAVGPKDVASMDYLIKNDAAITATTEQELEEKLKELIETPALICEYGKKAWECGKRNHRKEAMQMMLKEDFEEIIYEGSAD